MATHTIPQALPPKRWRFWQRPTRRQRRLKLVETLPLGERRFVAVVNVDGRDFLVGAAPQSVALLTELINENEDLPGALYTSREVQ